MEIFYDNELKRKNSMLASSGLPSNYPDVQETPSVPRKRFKNNEISSSYSSTKSESIPDSSMRARLGSIDPQIPIPLKRKRAREDSDNEEETPNKKRRRNVITTNTIATQTAPEDDSIFSSAGNSATKQMPMGLSQSTESPPKHARLFEFKTGPVISSQIKSPMRNFTLEEHAKDDMKKEARLRRYLEAIRKAVSGSPPKFYEPPVAPKPALVAPLEPPSAKVPAIPVISSSSDIQLSSSIPKLLEATKPIFSFGTTSSAAATTVTSSVPAPFTFAVSASSTSAAATTTTTTSTGSISSSVIQPPVTSLPSAVNFNFQPSEVVKPNSFTGFLKTEPQLSDSPSGSPIHGRKIAKGNRRLIPKENTNPISATTSGFTPFSFGQAVTTQAPTFGVETVQAPTFNFGSGTSQPSAFGSNSTSTFKFGQPNTQAGVSVSSTTQPFAFGAPNVQPPVFGNTTSQPAGVAAQFAAPQAPTFNAQLPTSFDFGGGGNVTASLSTLNSTAGSLFAPGTPGGVMKRPAPRRSKYGRR